jgi:hypothetical protein
LEGPGGGDLLGSLQGPDPILDGAFGDVAVSRQQRNLGPSPAVSVRVLRKFDQDELADDVQV